MAAALESNIGVNWGTMMSHPLDPKVVVQMLKANGINKVKLFDADPWTMSALAGTGIQVMVAIPNDQLARMSSSYDNAKDWVNENVTGYDYNGGVNIKYVAVGNEPFLKSYNGSFLHTTFPALKNIQQALHDAGVGDRIKATVPLNADVYASPQNDPVPSAGSFRPDIRSLMTGIVKFLRANSSPFVINIYPFLSLYQDPDFPSDYAFFDGCSRPVDDRGTRYTNVFDASLDTLVWSLRKAGVPDMRVVVGEVGWPTDGDARANAAAARKFYGGLLRKLAKGAGTPMRKGRRLEVYLFGLFDEDTKSVEPGNFERHWGIFRYDGKAKFKMDLAGKGNGGTCPVEARGVEHLPREWCVFDEGADSSSLAAVPDSVNYACSSADCTPLGLGCSCHGLSAKGNVSYAFNAYFQTMDQDARACDFGGLAAITAKDPSTDKCYFPVQIVSGAGGAAASLLALMLATLALLVS